MMSFKPKQCLDAGYIHPHPPKKKNVTHSSPVGVFNFLSEVFLETLKVTQQCKVARPAAHAPGCAALPPSLPTQSPWEMLGNKPEQSFMVCSPHGQMLQSLPSWICHHHLDWHRPNSNIGACHSVRLLKCLCTCVHS